MTWKRTVILTYDSNLLTQKAPEHIFLYRTATQHVVSMPIWCWLFTLYMFKLKQRSKRVRQDTFPDRDAARAAWLGNMTVLNWGSISEVKHLLLLPEWSELLSREQIAIFHSVTRSELVNGQWSLLVSDLRTMRHPNPFLWAQLTS